MKAVAHRFGARWRPGAPGRNLEQEGPNRPLPGGCGRAQDGSLRPARRHRPRRRTERRCPGLTGPPPGTSGPPRSPARCDTCRPASRAPARLAPRACWTRAAVAGIHWSGVLVATRMRSRFPAPAPALCNACRATRTARSDVAVSGPAMRRCRIPVRRTIHPPLISRKAARSSFVITRSGTAAPTPRTVTQCALMVPPLALLLR